MLNFINNLVFLNRAIRFTYKAFFNKKLTQEQIVYLCPNKMGSSTFAKYFSERGYSTYHGVIWRYNWARLLSRRFDVLCDGYPRNLKNFIKSLSKQDKIIIGKRDIEPWINSRILHIEHNKRGFVYTSKKIFWENSAEAVEYWRKQYDDFYRDVFFLLNEFNIDYEVINLDESNPNIMIFQLDKIFDFKTNPEKVITNTKSDRNKILVIETNPFHFETLFSLIHIYGISEIDIYVPHITSNRGGEFLKKYLDSNNYANLIEKPDFKNYQNVLINTIDSKSGLLIAIKLIIYGVPFECLIHNFKLLSFGRLFKNNLTKAFYSIPLKKVCSLSQKCYTISDELNPSDYPYLNIVYHDMSFLEKYISKNITPSSEKYNVVIGGYSPHKKNYELLPDIIDKFNCDNSIYFLGNYNLNSRNLLCNLLINKKIKCYFFDNLGDIDFLDFVYMADKIINLNKLGVYGSEKVSAQQYLSRTFGKQIISAE